MRKYLFVVIFSIYSCISFAQTVPSYVPTANLIGWYPFTGNTIDSSGHGNNGTVYGATLTTDRFGNYNSAYSFDGSSNYIQVVYPVSLNIDSSNGFCMSAWYKFNSLPGSQPEMIMRIIDSVNSKQFTFDYDAISQTLNGCNGLNGYACYDDIISLDTPSMGIWYNVILNSDFTTHQMSFYINGLLQGTSISTDTMIKPQFKYIDIGVADVPYWYMNGAIDDIGIWSRALSPCEIYGLYHSSVDSCGGLGTKSIQSNYPYQTILYPNPATSTLTITSPQPITQITITNLLGQVVCSHGYNSSQVQVDVATLPAGVYFVQVNGVEVTKFIKE